MGSGSGAGVAHALAQGVVRTLRAPALLGGLIAVAVLLPLSGPLPPLSVAAIEGTFASSVAEAAGVLASGQPVDLLAGGRVFLLYLAVCVFLTGGALDRFARARPTRPAGFFGACGAHFFPLARLTLLVTLLESMLVFVGEQSPGNGLEITAMVIIVAVSIIAMFGRVRLVVEDRRSGLASLVAGARFIRRNPSAILLCGIWAGIALAAGALEAAVLSPDDSGGIQYLIAQSFDALFVWIALAWHASAIALFQSRLAHAGYAAGPPLAWPESPAVEAILNAAPAVQP